MGRLWSSFMSLFHLPPSNARLQLLPSVLLLRAWGCPRLLLGTPSNFLLRQTRWNQKQLPISVTSSVHLCHPFLGFLIVCHLLIESSFTLTYWGFPVCFVLFHWTPDSWLSSIPGPLPQIPTGLTPLLIQVSLNTGVPSSERSSVTT